MTEDGNFLARWSQRKRQALEEARKPPEPVAETPAEPEEEPFDLSLLPDLEALTPETDISLFMRKGVPDTLRNAALRKMWALDPAIRDAVGDALDYAWDWNAPGGVPGGGELGAGFDTAKMVAQIFGDGPADKKVIEDVAVQQDAPETFANVAESQRSNLREDARSDENPLKLSTYVNDEPKLPVAGADGAVHKRRRHGSAAPGVSSKSIVS